MRQQFSQRTVSGVLSPILKKKETTRKGGAKA
jgi:hypothetical protein